MKAAGRFAVAFLVAASACAAAGAQETVVTPLETHAAEGIGYKYRKVVDAANRAMLRGEDPLRSTERLAPVLRYCDEQRSQPGRIAISVSSAAEYERYMAAHRDGTPVEWIDIACPMAYKAMAFMHVERKEYTKALEYLDTTAAMTPYWGEARVERGFALNMLRRFDEGLASYREALEMAEASDDARVGAMALRGIGYTLIELRDLDGAQAAYEQSLQLDPDNATATRELDYIRQQRERATGG